MDYALAKKLKDAGFPQPKEGRFYDKSGKFIILAFEEHDKEALGFSYIPIFSELIEACGDEFLKLERIKYKNDINWDARSKMREDGMQWSIILQTPEEAVANLWLELNKK